MIVVMYVSMGDMIKLPIPNIIEKTQNPVNYAAFLITISLFFIIWGFDIIKNGIKNIIHKMPNMDSLIGIGVTITFLYSLYNSYLIYSGKTSLVNNLYFESSCMIILFIKIGRFIDKNNKEKAVDTIKNLVTITPKQATRLKDKKEEIIPINEIKKDDIIVCKPGEKIAVDGIIVKGETHTDESFLTGESKPVSKKISSKVLAGSINYDGYIEYKAINVGKDSTISHIVDLVVEATNTKAPIARLADKISGYFVPTIFIISVISFLLNMYVTKNVQESIEALVSVLVVACPCSLGLATPLAMVVSIGKASKNGIIIKSSECLEKMNNIDTVIFDKTGTLTKGELEISDFKLNDTLKEDENNNYFKILQSIESKSNHPLAKSICKNSKELFDVESFEEVSGRGINGKINGIKYYAGNRKYLEESNINNIFEKEEKDYSKKGESIIYFWNETKIIAIIGLRDEIKPKVKETISKLIKLNKRVIMLSGDNEITAKTIGNEIGISEIFSNNSPKEKFEKIKELNDNNNVIMVGDGINDSPALKSASIGISVSNGSDISLDASDIMLLNDDMNKIIDLFSIGKKTIKIIKENLFWALFYNICMIPLATRLLPIKLNPMIAALFMTLSSFTVVVNSLRLKK